MRGLSLLKPSCNYVPRNNIIKSFSSVENTVIATMQSKPLLIGTVRTTSQGGSRVSRSLRSGLFFFNLLFELLFFLLK
jgi:hypothetical protein